MKKFFEEVLGGFLKFGPVNGICIFDRSIRVYSQCLYIYLYYFTDIVNVYEYENYLISQHIVIKVVVYNLILLGSRWSRIKEDITNTINEHKKISIPTLDIKFVIKNQ